MNIQNSPYLSAVQMPKQNLAKVEPAANRAEGLSFEEILARKVQTGGQTGELKFSKHASVRLSDRNIELTSGQMERLCNGAKKAGEKGIHESLVVVDDLAFIVNIPNKTVVTAMNQADTQDNVFTNIDGAVFM